MILLTKQIETVNNSKRVHYLFSTGVKKEGKEIVLDATDTLREANQKDKRRDYPIENGPNFGIEVARAIEYAEYVAAHATHENYFRFSTDSYSVFLNTENK